MRIYIFYVCASVCVCYMVECQTNKNIRSNLNDNTQGRFATECQHIGSTLNPKSTHASTRGALPHPLRYERTQARDLRLCLIRGITPGEGRLVHDQHVRTRPRGMLEP